MIARKHLLTRLVLAVGLLIAGFFLAPTARANEGNYTCKICSDGFACCPTGTVYINCHRSWSNPTTHCTVVKIGGFGEEEVEADGSEYE